MSITINGTQVDSVTFNNTNITTVCYYSVASGGEFVFGEAPDYMYIENPSTTDSVTIKFTVTQSSFSSKCGILYYSFSNTHILVQPPHWTRYKYGTNITLEPLTKIYWAGTSNTLTYLSVTDYVTFSASGDVKAGGNIMSLIDGNYFWFDEYKKVSVPKYCFAKLFKDCTQLLTPPRIPAIAMNSLSFYETFYGCTGLTSIPALQVTTDTGGSSPFSDMFNGCTQIKVSDTNEGEYTTAFFAPTVGIGSNSDMFANTGGAYTGGATSGNTYYTSNPVVS